MKSSAITFVTFLILAGLPKNAARGGQLELLEDEEKLQLNAVKEEMNLKLDALKKEEAIKMKAVMDEKKIRIEELNGMAKKRTKTNNMVEEKGDLEMMMEDDLKSEMMENSNTEKIKLRGPVNKDHKFRKEKNTEKTKLRGPVNTEHKFESRIVGGTEAAPGEFPFSVHYTPIDQSGNEYTCGGSLISPNIVLTAAHCWAENGRVRVGSVLPNSGGAVAEVAESVSHPDYDPSTTDNDYMILELDRDIDTNAYRPIELNFDSNTPETDDRLTVIGFGTTSEGGSLSNALQKVRVPVVSTEACQGQYGSDAIKKDIHICAGFPRGGKDSCQGDSGGPIFKQIDGIQKQVGVVSWGMGCAREGFSGVYARVSGASSWLTSEICSRSSEPKPLFCDGFGGTQLSNESVGPGECKDSPINWVDSIGDNCGVWESHDYWCAEIGTSPNLVGTDGKVAAEACCVCGGGTQLSGESVGSGECKDSPINWIDSDNDNCGGYESNENWCAEYGTTVPGTDGKVAAEACCVCGGGAFS